MQNKTKLFLILMAVFVASFFLVNSINSTNAASCSTVCVPSASCAVADVDTSASCSTAGQVCCKTSSSDSCCVDDSRTPSVCGNPKADGTCSAGTKKTGACSSYCPTTSSPASTGPIIPPELAGLPTNPDLVKGIFTNVANFLLSIIGIIAIISFVISGIQYFLVATDEKMMETAKKTMVASIIGLVVALFGYIAVKTVEMLLKGG